MSEPNKSIYDRADDLTRVLDDENVTQIADTIFMIALVVIGATLINGISYGFELSKLWDWRGFVIALGTAMIYMLVVNKGIMHGSVRGSKTIRYEQELEKKHTLQSQLTDTDFNHKALFRLNDRKYAEVQESDTQAEMLRLKQHLVDMKMQLKMSTKKRHEKRYQREIDKTEKRLQVVQENGVVVKDFVYYTQEQLFNYSGAKKKRVLNPFAVNTENEQLKESFAQRFILPIASLLFNGLNLALFAENAWAIFWFVIFQILTAIILYLTNYIKQKRIKESKGVSLLIEQNKILDELVTEFKKEQENDS